MACTNAFLEACLKKKLLHDGHGTGEERRLISIIKNLTKFCLVEERPEEAQKTHHSLIKDLAIAVNVQDKYTSTLNMYDRTFAELDKSISDKKQQIESTRAELNRLVLELEYVEKCRKVDAFPDSVTTEQTMKEVEMVRGDLMRKLEKQRTNIKSLDEACKKLRKILEDDDCSIKENSMDDIVIDDE